MRNRILGCCLAVGVCFSVAYAEDVRKGVSLEETPQPVVTTQPSPPDPFSGDAPAAPARKGTALPPTATAPTEPSKESESARPLGASATTNPVRFDPAGIAEFGGRGLYHTLSAQPFSAGSFWLSNGLQFFQASGFLAQGDTHRRLLDRISLTWTPLASLELAAGFSIATNHNGAFTPEQNQSFGDPYVRLHYGREFARRFVAGLDLQTTFANGSELFTLTDGISHQLLLALDYRLTDSFLVVFNLGYVFDGSRKVFDYPLNASQAFALGLSLHDQMRLSLGCALGLDRWAPFVEVGYNPMIGGSLGLGDNPGVLTLGVRGHLLANQALQVLLAADIGLTGVDAPGGNKRVPPYNLILGIGFDLGKTQATQTKVEVREVIREKIVEVPAAAPVAALPPPKPKPQLTGRVINKATKEPVPGAKISFVGNENTLFLSDTKDGTFSSCPLEPGNYRIHVEQPYFKPETTAVVVAEEGGQPVTIELVATSGPAFGTLKGTVRAVGGVAVPALISVPTAGVKVRAFKDTGAFEFRLTSGIKDVIISQPGYVTQRRKVQMGPGDIVILNVELYPKK